MRLPLFALAFTAVVSAQTGGTVEGRVVSSLDGRPVKRATVILRGVPSAAAAPVPESYACLSAADGRFVVKDVASGAYEVSAQRAGFQDNATGVARLLTVAPGQSPTVDLRLIPLGIISGRVVDENGVGVYARVAAMRYKYVTGKAELSPIYYAVTNDRGEYRLEVTSGRWYLRASRDSHDPPQSPAFENHGVVRERAFPTLYYPGVSDPKRAVMLDVAPGVELQHVDTPLRREMVYAIRAKAPPGVVPILRGTSVAYVTRGAAKPDDLEIAGLPPGIYTVMADRIDPSTRQVTPYALQRVEITSHDVDGVDLLTPTALEISGTVRMSGAGSPPESLVVEMISEDGQPRDRLGFAVKEDGSFTAILHPDAYSVTITGLKSAYLQSVRIGDRELPDHRLNPGRDTGKLTLTLSTERGRVEGSVVDASGSPAVHALVTLIPDQSLPFWIDLYRTVRTAADGTFAIPGVVPGDYRAFAWADSDSETPMDPDFRKPFEGQGADVKVQASEPASAKLTLIGR